MKFHNQALSKNIKVTAWALTLIASSASAGTVPRNECATSPAGSIFCEDFEGTDPKANFDDYDGNLNTENQVVVTNGPANEISNKAIRLRVPEGQGGGSDLFKVFSTGYDKLYARWYFMYEPGFNFNARNHGSGLAAGDRNLVGSSGIRPSGSDWAGFFIQYQERTAKTYAYSYYRGMYQDCTNPNGSCWGDSLPCLYDNGEYYCTQTQHRPTVTQSSIVAGEWYCAEQMIDLGTPTSTAQGASGRIMLWLNSTLTGDIQNLWIRTTPSLKLNNLWLSLYHHDETHSAVGELIDNVLVSTQYIGCGAANSAPPPKGLRIEALSK